MQKPEDFSKFYYTKVGLGEACGCAEKVIDIYEFNRKAGGPAVSDRNALTSKVSFRTRLRRLGLLPRPKRP